MATMTWPNVIGDDRYTKRFIDELDSNGNQIYIGKAPVVNASVNDDGWWIRKQYFDGSDRLIGYHEFTGIWSARESYRFGPPVTVTVNPIGIRGVITTSPAKIKFAEVFGRAEIAPAIRPMPVNPRAVTGRLGMASYVTAGKNWSTVVTKVRRAYVESGYVVGKGVVAKIKASKIATSIQVIAEVTGTK